MNCYSNECSCTGMRLLVLSSEFRKTKMQLKAAKKAFSIMQSAREREEGGKQQTVQV